MRFTAVIEQTCKYKKRMKYIAETDSFVETDCYSLAYVRGVRALYGWLRESGTPPAPHLDIYIMSEREFELGDQVEVDIIGVFWRTDGDHKLAGVLTDRGIDDISQLDTREKEDLYRLYSGKYEGEGWYGRERAEETVRDFFKKTGRIIK